VPTTVYDEHADFYVDFVDRVGKTTPHLANIDALLAEVGALDGIDVCDLACGEGFLSRILADRGAHVTGFDQSTALIERARARSRPSIRFEVSDAQSLPTVPDEAFDIVFCHMAAMDIAAIDALFATVHRVLKPQGRFYLTVLHPCFETPFDAKTERIVEQDEAGRFVALRVMRYRREGHWQSGGTGVRGHMGAFHRMLSTYLNALIEAGLRIRRLLEPLIPIADYADINDQWAMNIPRRLTICTAKE